MRIICFKIREDELEKLDRLAVRLKKTRSEVIREAIRRSLRTYLWRRWLSHEREVHNQHHACQVLLKEEE